MATDSKRAIPIPTRDSGGRDSLPKLIKFSNSLAKHGRICYNYAEYFLRSA